ncbi:MAG: hypothetical protein IPM64_01465 [Phycisphaerales bacterium]|nr:hypothetical protein [Phycisphaerales bacterium]
MNEKRVIRWAAVVAICLFGVLALTGWYLAGTSPLRAALPWTARDVKDVLLERPAPTVDYLLRASITSAEYDAFVERAGMSPLGGGSENPLIVWAWTPPADAPEWWRRGEPAAGTRAVVVNDGMIVATYEDGVLFVRYAGPVPGKTR